MTRPMHMPNALCKTALQSKRAQHLRRTNVCVTNLSRTKRPMQHHVAPHRRCRFFVHVPRENAGRNTMSHLTAAGCIAADPLRPAKLAAMTYDCYDCHYMTVMTFPRYDCYDFSLFPFILERLPRLPTPTKLITAFEARTHLVRSFH